MPTLSYFAKSSTTSSFSKTTEDAQCLRWCRLKSDDFFKIFTRHDFTFLARKPTFFPTTDREQKMTSMATVVGVKRKPSSALLIFQDLSSSLWRTFGIARGLSDPVSDFAKDFYGTFYKYCWMAWHTLYGRIRYALLQKCYRTHTRRFTIKVCTFAKIKSS